MKRGIGRWQQPRTFVRGMCAAVSTLVISLSLIAAPQAKAFKPYTHVQTGYDAYADAVNDGNVTIEGKAYPVNPTVLAALRTYPAHFNAGVIGPDGFPDLTMGQSVIHPENTGRWLDYVLSSAWAAQTGPYNNVERGQILAFAYGFLTHAAGDMWAHTLVNELSGDVFPGIGEITTDVNKTAIAVRHLVLEGYIGDATQGADGNPNRTALPNGDISDDETPGVAFDAPHRWVYETLVRPDAPGAPTAARGPIIDSFVSLRAQLVTFRDTNPQPLQAAINTYNNYKRILNNAAGACSFDDVEDIIDCPIAIASLPFALAAVTAAGFADLAARTLAAGAKAIANAYVNAWITDIDDGLRAWSELGLATTKGLFDPGTRRAAQNDECGTLGSELAPTRARCEDGVGPVDAVLFSSKDFIRAYLIPMLGLPDVTSDILAAIEAVSDTIDQVIGASLNPIRDGIDAVKTLAIETIKDILEDRFGLPIEFIETLLANPSALMDVTSVSIAGKTIPLFAPSAHVKLDGYLGLPAGHHSGGSGSLGDDVAFNPANFAAYRNAATTAKLLLLDGQRVDSVLTDLTGKPYSLYAARGQLGNIMTTTLPVTGTDPTQWLKLIDGDHAWRSDGQPIFAGERAGSGNFPLWESCVLRDRAFRTIYKDWENGSANFPDLGDQTSADPNDPNLPVSTLAVGTPKFVNGTTTYVAASTPLIVNATDSYWTSDRVTLEVRIRPGAATGGAFSPIAKGTALNLSRVPDGVVHIDLKATDPCATEAEHTIDVVRDTKPPVVTYSEPPKALYATNEVLTYGFDDGTGSGVASYTVTLDGAAAPGGLVLDTFLIPAGKHSIELKATDNVGNSGSTTHNFRVRATSASLLSNHDRAWTLGLITSRSEYLRMRANLEGAVRAHDAGKHGVEPNYLSAYRDQLSAQRGRTVDADTVARFIGYIKDLIESATF
jgi:hypothetical protein